MLRTVGLGFAVLLGAAQLVMAQTVPPATTPLTAKWPPRPLAPGDRVVMLGPDEKPTELMLEVLSFPSDAADIEVETPDRQVRQWAAFRLMRAYGGYPGVVLPVGTRARGTFTFIRRVETPAASDGVDVFA